MGTKNNPGKFDCYANAEPDEPMFVLLARDQSAPDAIEAWINLRIANGEDPDSDKIDEAYECARKMRAWRKANRS